MYPHQSVELSRLCWPADSGRLVSRDLGFDVGSHVDAVVDSIVDIHESLGYIDQVLRNQI